MNPHESITVDNLIRLNRSTTVANLVAGTAHEVNNALQIVAGTVELLLGNSDVSPAVRNKLERVLAQSSKAAGAMNRVLTFMRTPLEERSPVKLREVVRQAMALREFAIRRRGNSIAFVDSDGLQEPLVHGSGALLQQAVLNLIINAEQALGTAGSGVIDIALQEEGSALVLRVTDSGPGVSRELAERIFDPFVTTGRTADSPGLGLSAVREIAARHGGTLSLEHSGAGASFVLRLPKL